MLDTLLCVTDPRSAAERTIVLDDALLSALRLAVRALEEQVIAARAGAELTGAPAPDMDEYLAAADCLRTVVASRPR